MISADNIQHSLTLSSGNAQAIAQHQKLMKAHELQKKAKNLPIPTNDKEVKLRLRELGHPICLFGEGPADRRDRLRVKVSEYCVEHGEVPAFCQKVTT
jgi:U4/U6 small nuclear ribonucleoprotein PRP4